MPALQINHKIILSLSIFILIICSVTVTIISTNELSDNLSITLSILLAMGFISTFSTTLLDIIESICNP